MRNILFKKLKVGSFNCQGLNDFYKRKAIFNFFKESDLAIICLQETKLHREFESQYVKEWHNHNCIFNSTSGGGKGGTAILINFDYIHILHDRLCDVEGRVIAIDVSIGGDIFHIVNSYGRNEHQFKVPFLNRLYVFLSSNKHTLWMGDHNIATDPKLDRFPERFVQDQGGKEFLEILETFDLRDACRVMYSTK